jgi:4-alpha-glucanotransferase
MDGSQIRQLHELARLYGVQSSFYNVEHKRQWATPEGITAVLQALGAPIAGAADVAPALRQRRLAVCEQTLAPVIVAWGGRLSPILLRLPEELAECKIVYSLALESGEVRSGSLDLSQLPVAAVEEVEGVRFVSRTLPLLERLPWGYHQLTIGIREANHQSLIIAAPETVYSPRSRRSRSQWGIFAPLYALHSARSWGGGDFTDGEMLVAWTAHGGGSMVGTLPFLAAFLDFPCDPSPYTPASRLFWNEFFVDITRLPELGACPTAQTVVGSDEFRQELQELNAARLVDYHRQMALKCRVLAELARHVFSHEGGRHQQLQRFAAAHEEVNEYARFRAVLERRRVCWPEWPARQRGGDLRDSDYDSDNQRYHVYAQFVADEQIAALARRADGDKVRLYFDLPLGVHPEGYDVWRHHDLFARDVSVGAPPDAFFPTGQDWSFPPWRPEAMRRQGYTYLIDCLRQQLRYAKMLRIDHVMGLHRFYWIPRGGAARDGVYVHYPSEEIYAIMSLESRRQKAVLVGENLGIVPGYVNRAMHRHGMAGISVVLHDLVVDPEGALRRLARAPRTVACLGTHDMYPFAAFWRDDDIADRLRLGIIQAEEAEREREQRHKQRQSLIAYLQERKLIGPDGSEPEVLRAVLVLLGQSGAQTVLINLEDLWLERVPQNIPGTTDEHPNWRQKTRLPLEDFMRQREVVEMLAAIDDLRRHRGRAR